MQAKRLPALLLILALIPACTAPGETRSPAVEYLTLVEQGIARTREDIPAITASAEETAKVLLAGGKFWAASSQPKFYLEAEERAGGFMFIHHIEGPVVAGDVVLFGATGTLDEQDAEQIKAWRDAGAHVVAFATSGGKYDDAPNALIAVSGKPGLPIAADGQDKLIPTDTVMNAVNLWVWTGEVVAACTRAGKMPIMYKSYGLEGGEERAKIYRGQRFHEDMQIAPIAAGVLGTAYLDKFAAIVANLKEQLPDIQRAAAWLRDTPTEHVLVAQMGHFFPEHWQDERAPQRFSTTWWNNYAGGIEGEPHPEHLVLWMGYQRAPQTLIQQVQDTGMKLVYASVESGDPAEPSDRVIYINPGWPITDSMLEIPGYDVLICPGSGVTNAILYWSILAESYAPLEHR